MVSISLQKPVQPGLENASPLAWMIKDPHCIVDTAIQAVSQARKSNHKVAEDKVSCKPDTRISKKFTAMKGLWERSDVCFFSATGKRNSLVQSMSGRRGEHREKVGQLV